MGQYYVLINPDKKEIVNSWEDYGSKLMEWSYCEENEPCVLMNLIADRWKGDRVFAVGDYADLNDPRENWYPEYRKMAEEFGNENIYRYAAENFTNIKDNIDSENHHWKRIYNHKTKQFIDLGKRPIEQVRWNDKIKEAVLCKIEPLMLLLAMGNGRGGGDYYGICDMDEMMTKLGLAIIHKAIDQVENWWFSVMDSDHTLALVGSWCSSSKYIEVSDNENAPEGYTEFRPDFTGNNPLIPYTRAAELMEKLRTEKTGCKE